MRKPPLLLLKHVCYIPKKEAKGSWPPKKSLNTSSGLRNVKVNPGKSDEKSELGEPVEKKLRRVKERQEKNKIERHHHRDE